MNHWSGTIIITDDPQKIQDQISDLQAEIRYIVYQVETIAAKLKALLPEDYEA